MAKKCLAGHKSCTCGMMCCSITPERAAEIAAQAASGGNWAEQKNDGPGCVCGAGQRTQDAAQALKGVHGRPSGMCARHSGGSVWASQPQVWDRIKEG